MKVVFVIFLCLFVVSSCDSIQDLERKVKDLDGIIEGQKEEIYNLKHDLKIYHHYIDQRVRRVEMKSS